MTQEIIFRVAQGALAGLVAAMVVDYNAFRSWKSLDEARTYDWGLALRRWLQGLTTGALSAFGLGTLF